MIDALYTAISGLNSQATSTSVTGNNIANLNTTGFKQSSTSFGNILGSTISGASGPNQTGNGSQVTGIRNQFTQGALIDTGNPLDLAVDGNGFFILRDANGGKMYTRSGNFSMDSQGYLVGPSGDRVQGYQGSAYQLGGATTDLKIDNSLTSSKATGKVDTKVNLNASATITSAAFTIQNNVPANYNFSTTNTVYDSQGGAHEVTSYFRKSASNTWEVSYTSPSASNPAAISQAAGTQTLTFDQSGTMINDNETPIQFDFGTGVQNPQSITFDYGKGIAEGGSGLDASRQLSANFQVLDLKQDGTAPGSVHNITLGQDGVITATLSNGQTVTVGQVALARFNDPGSLAQIGSNLYVQSAASGEAITGAPGTSGMGRMLSGTLETSNVDLESQMVGLISSENAYKANTKTIRTSQDMLNEVLGLKR